MRWFTKYPLNLSPKDVIYADISITKAVKARTSKNQTIACLRLNTDMRLKKLLMTCNP